ncbi:hypothetical protein AALB39_08415 [Lachnospiraceae bacterium 54-53]
MRKNKLLAAAAVVMTVMLAATACGSKDNTTTETKQETSAEAGAAESSEAKEEETTDEAEESTDAAQKTASDAGSLVSGVFTSVSGKYQITPPEGWTIEEDGDESAVAFSSPNGSDILEVTYVEGDDADGAREVYPDTKEEYQELISRGEDMEFVRYDVENGSDGSQTFRYAIRYNTPQDGIRYYSISGSYDAAAKKYISAAGTIESPDSAVEGQIEAALDSLKLN